MNLRIMGITDEAKRVLRVEAEAVLRMADRLGEEFERATGILKQCKGRVIVTGMGKSGLVGKKIAATLASTGTPAFFLHPAEASHGDLGTVTDRDVILAISNSGETEEIIGLIPYLKRFDVKLISMTGKAGSTLSRASDVALDISVREEACPMGIVPTASTTAAMAMGDALAVALLTMRGFSVDDFAAFHPKGSLGKKLLIKVSDLMHSGEGIPRVRPETPMTETVIEMSSKRLGVTTVVDEGGRLMGIITDGDLRRGIEKWSSRFFDMKAGEVMIRDPKSIEADALAAKALAVMERHSITSLVVPDGDGTLLGVIHLHDILRQGIV
jgi:arabinose-5-phosphate isomerase